MNAMIPLPGRRLAINLSFEPVEVNLPTQVIGASDAELAHLGDRRRDLESARWDVWAAMYGMRR